VAVRATGAKVVKVCRLQLYEHIWSTPLITVASQFNISDVVLKSTCARFDIPVPPRQGAASLPLPLIEPTELSLRPRCLDILHGPVLCLRIVLLADFCSGIFHRPDVNPCIMHAPDLCSDITLGPYMFAVIFHAPELWPCIFLGRPSLKLVQQGFGWRLTDFGLTLSGRLNSAGNFVARLFLVRPSLELLQQGFGRWLTDFGLALMSGFKSGSNFAARQRFACCRQQSRGVGG
jgi:hypothetical protein